MADSDLFDGDPLGVASTSSGPQAPGTKPVPTDVTDVTAAGRVVKNGQLATCTPRQVGRDLGELYVRLTNTLGSVLRRFNSDAFDVAYDTMVDLLIALRDQPHRFDSVSNIPGYIAKSALRRSYRHAVRGADHQAILNNALASQVLASDTDPRTEDTVLRRAIGDALNGLPSSWRGVVIARLIDEDSAQEAAARLGLKPQTVNNYLRDARNFLRIRLMEVHRA